jgi:poly(3-hydroxybutyrate) depolymerase
MTGFSNGAMMTKSFAAYRPDLVAAIAPVSGGWITAYVRKRIGDFPRPSHAGLDLAG